MSETDPSLTTATARSSHTRTKPDTTVLQFCLSKASQKVAVLLAPAEDLDPSANIVT